MKKRPPVSHRTPKPRADRPAIAPDTPPKTGEVRLQRLLALAGFGSRRHCEEFIQAGRVTIDGETVATLGTKVDPQRHKVFLDGKPIKVERKVYYVLNKPPGYISTNDDPGGRARVIDLIPHSRERLFTVGRLDESSQGLIIVTNDGILANKLAHPRYEVAKIYRVLVAGFPTEEELRSLKTGHDFSEGTFRVSTVKDIKTVGQSTLLEIMLKEGKNREIRRLLARIGHKVMRLERIAFGPLRLGRLRLGEFRQLTPDEVRQLKTGRTNTGSGAESPKGHRPRKKTSSRSRSGAGKKVAVRKKRP
ncbi:MAG: pseudouridine synthase [Planctomycetales bacterium]